MLIKKYFILIVLIIALLNAGGYAQKIDSAEAKYWADVITDSSVSVGVFTNVAEPQAKPLKNGLVPEFDENFAALSLKYFLVKLETDKTIKGNFDNSVFIQLTPDRIDGNINAQFFPYTGATLLLSLKKCFENGLLTGWEGKGNIKAPFLIETTAYRLNNLSRGTAYLTWPPEYKKLPGYINADKSLIADIEKLYEASDRPLGQKMSALHTVEKNINTAFGKAIWVFLQKKIEERMPN